MYSDWIDACDQVAKEAATGKAPTSAVRGMNSQRPVAAAVSDGEGGGGYGGGDDFVVDDDLDAEGEYADDD